MNRDHSTDLMLSLAAKVGRQAAGIGASLASLAAWAFGAGYIYELSYFSNLGARWIVGSLGATDLLSAGASCIAIVLFTVAVAVFIRALIQHSDAVWSRTLHVTWILPAAIGVTALVFHTAWMPSLSAVVSLLCVTLSTAGVMARVFYTGGTHEFTSGQKVIASLSVPLFALMFPWFVGFNVSKLDVALEDSTFPRVEILHDDDKLSWRLIRVIGDKMLLSATAETRVRTFRIVSTTDAKLIYGIGDNRVSNNDSTRLASPR
jgi:hypothetical protein